MGPEVKSQLYNDVGGQEEQGGAHCDPTSMGLDVFPISPLGVSCLIFVYP